jgi:CheY-like chemotaxis protein
MMHVLCIEPDNVLGRTYTQALQHAGYSTAYAAAAQDAIDCADHQQPDLVVLELQMTGHDGIEFLHEFRSYPEWRDIPVIVNTTLAPTALEPVGAALAELGVVTCLYKPYTTLQQLLSATRLQLAAQ